MATLTGMRADSTEYVTATITADHDITGDTISIACPQTGQEPDAWTAATVLSVDKTGDTWTVTYRLLVGPNGGDITLTPGSYDWLVKVADNPEQPVRKVATFKIV